MKPSYEELEARCAALAAENAGLKAACERVSMWDGFPQVTLRSTGEVVPYVVAYGSNGERDYMRNIAALALKENQETDVFLAEVRASAVEEFVRMADYSESVADGEVIVTSSSVFAAGHEYAAQFRKGVHS